ncbi:SCARECROW-like 14 [Actinidia rufa]|uniref:SCARECROW-like 14 n=1 Tax=Actinidia rufa TaxID=165716 RepID=A0A7J0GWM2_9ERIC|nr:SCARECROW-like 14 [Actinidia rufa]
MVMDKKLGGYYGSINRINRIKYDKETLSVLSDQKFINGFKGGGTYMDHNFVDLPPFSSDLNPGVVVPPFGMTTEVDSHADYDFSDGVLKFINQMLMEEDMEEKTCMFQESAALQAAERSFYEVLGEKYPPSPDHRQIRYLDQNVKNSNEFYGGTAYSDYNTSSSTGSSVIVPSLTCDQSRYESPPGWSVAVDLASQSTPQSSFSSSSSYGNAVDGLVDSPESMLRVPDKFNDTHNFVKEAKEEEKSVVVKVETEYALDGLRGKKNPHPEELDLEEGRSNKQSAVYADGTVRSEMFDQVLLCNGGKSESALREALQNGVNKNMQESGQSKGSNGGKVRGTYLHMDKCIGLGNLMLIISHFACAAGEVACQSLGPLKNGGVVVGIDQKKVKVPSLLCDARVQTVCADVMNLPKHQLRELSPQLNILVRFSADSRIELLPYPPPLPCFFSSAYTEYFAVMYEVKDKKYIPVRAGQNQQGFSVILSDMRPLVSGIRTKDAAELGMQALTLAVGGNALSDSNIQSEGQSDGSGSGLDNCGVLKPGGHLVIKFLESKDVQGDA